MTETPIQRLLGGPLHDGVLVWIAIRPSRHAPMIVRPSANVLAGRGVEGDRYDSRANGARQATFIAEEDIAAVASFLGRNEIAPEMLRRNFVTRGINLIALKGRNFRVGDAVFETTGECAPCSLMEDALGPGGFNAVRGHGGITARILSGGVVRLGDAVQRMESASL